MNAELVHEISVAMGEMTEKMVSLIRGKLPLLTPAATSSNMVCVGLRHEFGNCFSIGPVLER